MSESQNAMHALVWTAPRTMEMQTQPIPTVAPEEVLIKVAYAGICGSELSGYLGHNALRVPPLVMGHEFSGTVVAMGEQAAALNPALAMGSRVSANPMIYCRTCEYCQRGQTHLCLNRTLIGAHRPGAFADYVTVPAWQVVPLPDQLSLHDGALSEPVACGVHIQSLAGDVKDQAVLIIGAGTIGLLSLQILKRQGAAPIYVSETNPQRLAIAADLGAIPLNPREQDIVQHIQDTTGTVAVAIDAVGLAITREQCVSATCRGGTVLLSGLHEEASAMPAADIIRKEITVQGSFCYTPEDFDTAVALLADGTVKIDAWVVEAPLSEGGDCFASLVDAPDQAAKILLVPPGAEA